MRTLPKIKVCGLTIEEDVDLTLSLGADYFGFILYPQSPRGVSLDRAVELAAAVPVGQRVAVDVATSLEDLKSYCDAGSSLSVLSQRYKIEDPVPTLPGPSGQKSEQGSWTQKCCTEGPEQYDPGPVPTGHP